MDQKLTLKLNQVVIENAKKYAKEHKKSLSRIIENYLKLITSEEKKSKEIEITPFVRSMSTSNTGKSVPLNAEKDKNLRDQYMKKHL